MEIRWFKPAHSNRLRLQIGKKVKGEVVWKNVPITFEDPKQEESFFRSIPSLKDVRPKPKKVSKLPLVERVG